MMIITTRLRKILCCTLSATLCVSVPMKADAQIAAPPAQDYPPPQSEIQQQQAGRIADTPVGEIGQRRTREEVEGVAPFARIVSRIQNRVESRVRNRIDRNYNAQVNTTSLIASAQDQARKAGRPR